MLDELNIHGRGMTHMIPSEKGGKVFGFLVQRKLHLHKKPSVCETTTDKLCSVIASAAEKGDSKIKQVRGFDDWACFPLGLARSEAPDGKKALLSCFLVKNCVCRR